MPNDQSRGPGCADLVAIVFLSMIGGVVLGMVLGHRMDGPGIVLAAKVFTNVVWGWLTGMTIGVCLAVGLWLKTSRGERHD